MPTYSYACTACGHAFDIQQSFSDDSLTVCPECEGRLRKVFSSVGVVFKGSGFYRNDARAGSGSGKSSSIPAESSSSASSSSSDTSTTSGSTSSTSATPAPAPAASSTPAAAPAASA
ncbi:FmdB family transcriptional regulator [Cellulomonas sp. JH27-2]|uniref:FmdB family zinc ribbon protein n=1 Tax=Cellulomonas sp. JH27-2 TaxID=2774139 RepID=UPI00177D83B4|nr:FmdB family transcriptional regulator [Cellulomonas sp. JH27-2]